MDTSTLITRREAAELSGTSLGTVDKAIEQKVLRVRRQGRPTLLTPDEVGPLAVLSQTRVALPVGIKQRVARWARQGPAANAELRLDSALLVRMKPEIREAVERAHRYVELRERLVEVNPEVRGGEPVFKGTRVPVRGLARQIELGETPEVLREDYPFLPEEAFDFAPLWARANPRQGRPRRPWAPETRTRRREPRTRARAA